jgi:hypothetical protein
MFTSIPTYSPTATVDTRFMIACADVRPWDQGRLHMAADADITTLAGRSLR